MPKTLTWKLSQRAPTDTTVARPHKLDQLLSVQDHDPGDPNAQRVLIPGR